jgi:Fe2+ transport system protein FeoA
MEEKVSLVLNSNYTIANISSDSETSHRLLELGFRKGLTVVFCGQAPFGGPYLFRMGAITLALRSEEMKCLNLRLI